MVERVGPCLQKCNVFIRNKTPGLCVFMHGMEIQEERLRRLEAGQLWKIEHGYIFIVELGRRLIHYKMLREPDQKAVSTRLIGIEALLNYLKQNEAELVT